MVELVQTLSVPQTKQNLSTEPKLKLIASKATPWLRFSGETLAEVDMVGSDDALTWTATLKPTPILSSILKLVMDVQLSWLMGDPA